MDYESKGALHCKACDRTYHPYNNDHTGEWEVICPKCLTIALESITVDDETGTTESDDDEFLDGYFI